MRNVTIWVVVMVCGGFSGNGEIFATVIVDLEPPASCCVDQQRQGEWESNAGYGRSFFFDVMEPFSLQSTGIELNLGRTKEISVKLFEVSGIDTVGPMVAANDITFDDRGRAWYDIPLTYNFDSAGQRYLLHFDWDIPNPIESRYWDFEGRGDWGKPVDSPYIVGPVKVIDGAGLADPRNRKPIYGTPNWLIAHFRMHINPEPPVADADGPYSIYVGDTLTLDGSGSTDADNDIVSYMWDLDDNGSFETDAGGQAVFTVDYAYLESLGLIINYTYNIHLKVTNSEGQSDVADSTLTIVPKPAMEVVVDIKPGSCPNPVNVKSRGVLPIAILGTDDYDVTTIDPTSIRLAGVEPLRSGYEDVAAPVSDTNDCNCTTEGPDGFLDLTLKFKTQRIVEAVGDVNDGDILTLELTGVLFDPMPFETPIEGADCILIKGWHKAHNKADINKDGVVDMTDFAIISNNWLQSSIVED